MRAAARKQSRPIDTDLAPVIDAWNATDWLITRNYGSRPDKRPTYIYVHVRLDKLIDFVSFLRAVNEALVETHERMHVGVDVYMHRCLAEAIWTERWGTFVVIVYGSSVNRSPTPAECAAFTALAMHVPRRANDVEDERLLSPALRRAMSKGSLKKLRQTRRAVPIQPLDRELAPVVKAWNAVDWLITRSAAPATATARPSSAFTSASTRSLPS